MAEVAGVVVAHAIVAWVITYLLHSTVLYGVARLLERLHDDPEWRSVVWRTAIFGPLVTASLQTAWPVGAPVRIGPETPGALLGPNPLLALSLVAAWVTVIGARAVAVVRAELRARTALGPRRVSRDPHLRRLLEEAAASAGLRRTPLLTISRSSFSPAALAPAEVCLPLRIFAGLPAEQRRALLAHEVAHLTRRDPLWSGAATALVRVLSFQPLSRSALVRLRRAAEHAADARALATSSPLDLARALAAIAPFALTAAGAGAAATGAPIAERVARILDPATPPARPLAALHLATTLLMLAGGCLALGPGVSFTPETAAESIPWLTPSRQEPNVRMLEVRNFDRELRTLVRRR